MASQTPRNCTSTAFQEWLAEAVKEPWIVEQDEIDILQGRPTSVTI